MVNKTGENFVGQKFFGKDFSRRNLKYANFSNASLIDCDFTESDLSYANFSSANCFKANFTNAKLYRTNMMETNLQASIFKPREAFGLTVTLKCETFTDMEVDPVWLNCWLFMPSLMKLPEARNGDKPWLDRIIEFIGPRMYERYKAAFNRRVV